MKKQKFSLGQGGLQGFFLQHVEKIVLGGVLMVVALFLYSGYGLEGYKPTKTPADLKVATATTLDKMELDTAIKTSGEPKRKPVTDYKHRADEGRKFSSAGNYPIGAINIPSFPPQFKRTDPQIYNPENIEVRPILASIIVQAQTGDQDPFQNDDDGSITKKAIKKASGKDKGEAPANPMGGGGKAPGAKPSGKPGDRKGDKGGKGGKGIDGGAMGFPGAADDGMFGGGIAGAGGMQGSAGTVSETFRKKYVYYQPGRGPGGNSDGGITTIGKTQYIVSIVATFPYEKQFEEYRRVFADAEGFEPLRDSPQFERVVVERAEVPADPMAGLVWTSVKISKKFFRSWVEHMPEVADERYTDPALTAPMPPVVMVDPAKLGSHPLIPRATTGVLDEASGGKKGSAEDDPDDGDDDFSGGRARRGGGGAGAGMGPGIGSGPGMAPGAADGMRPGASRPPGGLGGGGMGMPGMPGMGMPGVGGPGGAGMFGGASPGAKTVKYKMIRFFDFYAVPDKQYRYRVKVVLEDPNNPPEGEVVSPEPRILDNAVTARIKDQAAKTPELVHYRESDWTESSAVVSLPPPVHYVVSSVANGRSVPIPGTPPINIYVDDPAAVMLAVVWDKDRAINVPGRPVISEKEDDIEKAAVYRGTFLNFKRDKTRVLRSDTLEIKSIKDHSFATNGLVVDLRPSESLPQPKSAPKIGDKKTPPLTTAGEVLLIDSQGRFIVRNELDDTEDFRMYTFADEDPKPISGGGSGIPGMGMSGEGGAAGFPGGLPGGLPGAAGGIPGMDGIGGGAKKGKK